MRTIPPPSKRPNLETLLETKDDSKDNPVTSPPPITLQRILYVLDTSIIADDPHCLDAFPDSNIIIHVSVLTELDKIKKYKGEEGRNARVFIKTLDRISQSSDGNSFKLDNNSLVTIDCYDPKVEYLGDSDYADNKLIHCARGYLDQYHVVLVSNDINLRLRAKAYGIAAKPHSKEDRHNADEIYSGVVDIHNSEIGAMLFEKGEIACADYADIDYLYPNECVVVRDDKSDKVIALGRNKGGMLTLVKDQTIYGGIKGKNNEQKLAIDMLMDPTVDLVSLIGTAGTGKTILCVSAAVDSLIKGLYNNVYIYRPIVEMGENSLGYTPGSVLDKILPWMGAVEDALFLITQPKTKKKSAPNTTGNSWQDKLGQYSDSIHFEALTYIRGRSLSNSYIIIDEAQNCTSHDIKTIITRCSQGSKIVICGDIAQVDTKMLDSSNNAVSLIAECFRKESIAGSITLTKGERSNLATLAAELL